MCLNWFFVVFFVLVLSLLIIVGVSVFNDVFEVDVCLMIVDYCDEMVVVYIVFEKDGWIFVKV